MREQKRKSRIFVFCLFAVLIIAGCNDMADIDGIRSKTEGSEAYDEAGHVHLGKTEVIGWKDNDLDDLQAVIDHSVDIISEEGQLDGGKASIFVCESGCMLFKNHLFENSSKNWSGISGISAEEKTLSFKVCVEPEIERIQIHEIGPVSGGSGYIACRYVFKDGKPFEYWFYELDENFQKVRCMRAKIDMNELLECVMGDAEGNVHVIIWRENEKHTYMIISSNGEKIYETDIGNGLDRTRLCSFGNGRVAVCNIICDNNVLSEYCFYEADLSKKELQEMPFMTENIIREKLKENLFMATPITEYEIAWCDYDGVYFYDMGSGQIKTAYEWSNHEIKPYEVYDFAVNNGGSVGLVYTDLHGIYYLLLKPTE